MLGRSKTVEHDKSVADDADDCDVAMLKKQLLEQLHVLKMEEQDLLHRKHIADLKQQVVRMEQNVHKLKSTKYVSPPSLQNPEKLTTSSLWNLAPKTVDQSVYPNMDHLLGCMATAAERIRKIAQPCNSGGP